MRIASRIRKQQAAHQKLGYENCQEQRKPIQVTADHGHEDRPGRPVGKPDPGVDPIDDGDQNESFAL